MHCCSLSIRHGVLVIASFLGMAPFQMHSQNASSCGYPDWFAVQRAQVNGKQLSSLCLGELDASENHRLRAVAELDAVINSDPASTEAYSARSTLAYLYLRIGRFHDAELQIEAMVASRPTAPDLANIRSLFRLLASHLDMTVAHAGFKASVPTHDIEGNIFAAVTVNGSSTSYMIDTGMDLSFMSESEAAHLGLVPESTTSRMNDISGATGSELKAVVVEDLMVGSTHLSHVPFLVFADTNDAFSGVPLEQQGVLGIQPLVALGRLSFQAREMLAISGRSMKALSTSPLLFAGTSPLTQILYKGTALTVTLDTGATQTTLNPPFAKLFPDLIRDGQHQSHSLNGVSGTTDQQSVSVPHLTLKLGRNVELTPAIVLLNQTTGNSAWAAANMGYDLLQQAKPFTLDFDKMVIELPTGP